LSPLIRPIGQWDVSKVTSLSHTFYKAFAFAQDLSIWTGSATETLQTNMLSSATAFHAKYLCPDVSGGPLKWCVCKSECPASSPPPQLPKIVLTDANIHSAIETCFYSNGGAHRTDGMCSSTEFGAMPDWDVSRVKDMTSLFSGYSTFNANISRWDVSAVKDMSDMFYQANSFKQDLNNWQTTSLTKMYRIFRESNDEQLGRFFCYIYAERFPGRLRVQLRHKRMGRFSGGYNAANVPQSS
jgi:hypothetical protein